MYSVGSFIQAHTLLNHMVAATTTQTFHNQELIMLFICYMHAFKLVETSKTSALGKFAPIFSTIIMPFLLGNGFNK